MTGSADRPRTWRMSFSMTPTQIVDGSKTVTRRHADTWRTIRAGDLIVPIRKGQGLKRGERQEPLIDGRLIVTSVRLEPLASVDADEMRDEGFDPDAWADPVTAERGPLGWVRWWAHGHGHGRGPTGELELEAWLRSTMCRRIEFRRADRCLVCPSCGASASLPLGVTCADHQPREVWS